MQQSQILRGKRLSCHTRQHVACLPASRNRQRAPLRRHFRAVEAPQVATTATRQPASAEKTKGYKDAVMFQAFGWDSCKKGGWYKKLLDHVQDLKEVSCTHAWLPPPSQSVSDEGYMPGQLYNLNSKYGGATDLIKLNIALVEAGISPVADIVINHRCADEMVDGKWNKFRDDVTHDGRRIDWGRWAIVGNDPAFGGTGNPDTGENYGPAPDLDHANPELRGALKDWLAYLKDHVWFRGWRLDFVKGYGAEFVQEYIDATVGSDVLSVGEYWVDMHWEGSELAGDQNAARQRLCDWIDGAGQRCCAFDFPLKGILQEAVRKQQYWRLRDKDGKPSGLNGWWPSKAVTFIDNHDTGSTQQHWPFPADYVETGYAYILTHPGMPCIFWDHYFEWGKELRNKISAMLKIRRRNNIVSDSKVVIKCAEADLYVAVVDDRVTLKMGARHDMGSLLPKASEGWAVATYGKDFCIWEKKSAS